MSGCIGGWVSQWMGSSQITKNQINLELIKIIQFCLNIYDLWRHLHLCMGVWVVWWMGRLMGGSMAGVMSNH